MKRLVALFFFVSVVTGCGPSQLEPTPSAPTTVAEDLAVDQVDGVTVEARTDTWPGDLEVLLYVTPVKMTLRNDSDEPIRLRYALFQLVGPRGERFAALPPFEIEGTVERPALAYPLSSPFRPRFHHRRFVVSRLYADYYPGFSVWNRPFFYDFDYYDHYYSYWNQPLPTRAMIELALPEGVLQPGGEVSGYLYFEKVGDDADRVMLRADVVSAENGSRMGSTAIQFNVHQG